MTPVSFTSLTPLAFLRRSAEVFADKTAIVYGDRRIGYREFAAEAAREPSIGSGSPGWTGTWKVLRTSRSALGQGRATIAVAAVSRPRELTRTSRT